MRLHSAVYQHEQVVGVPGFHMFHFKFAMYEEFLAMMDPWLAGELACCFTVQDSTAWYSILRHGLYSRLYCDEMESAPYRTDWRADVRYT
jgi:hypothetical protein